MIRSGKGAGLGVLLGILLQLTVIGPIIAGFFSFRFLNDISDDEYLSMTDAKEINFKKGFYSAAVFGWLVAIICCQQWKNDMISVLEGDPTGPSENKHLCFKVWFCLDVALTILYLIIAVTIPASYTSNTTRTTTTYRYR